MSALSRASLWHREIIPTRILYELIDQNASIPAGGTYTAMATGLITGMINDWAYSHYIQIYHSPAGWVGTDGLVERSTPSFICAAGEGRWYNPAATARTLFVVFRRTMANLQKFQGTLAAGATLTLPHGIITSIHTASVYLEAFDGAAWNRTFHAGCFASDGTNLRLRNTTTESRVYVFFRCDWK